MFDVKQSKLYCTENVWVVYPETVTNYGCHQLMIKVLSIVSVNRLTWHNGVIPAGEIWVKIGGDKGGKSVKASFQICNVPNPNSVQNTCVFAVFEARDTPTNLHVALSPFQDQVSSLQGMMWR